MRYYIVVMIFLCFWKKLFILTQMRVCIYLIKNKTNKYSNIVKYY